MSKGNFWDDIKSAQKLIMDTNSKKELLNTFSKLNDGLLDLELSINDLSKSFDDEMFLIVDEEYKEISNIFDDFEIRVLLSGPYDKNNAILELHPGAGGTEAQDWCEMLYRMYSRWCEKHKFKFKVLDYQDGDEAGIKSCSILVEGFNAYGLLKAEKGVHRLVRISPFDSGGRRHTSFASVEVTPEFDDDVEVEINESDLEVSTMRASGAGGQHINKTDSAVRILHKPSGIVVTCQTERSQLKNREQALNMLKSKLYLIKLEEQQSKINSIKGEQKAIEWGSQIRSYVFTPYTMVKDLRTNYEIGNVNAVMDGEIDGFIFSYLKSNISI